MVHLFKDPKGENVMVSTYATELTTTVKSLPMIDDFDQFDEVAGLRKRITELEKKLAEVL